MSYTTRLLLWLVFLNGAFTQEPLSRIGQKVVTKYKYPVKNGNQLVEKQNLFHVYTVKQTNGDRLLVGWEGKEGWLPASQVVPFDQAINFYTQEIEAKPGSSSAWSERGIIWTEKKEMTSPSPTSTNRSD